MLLQLPISHTTYIFEIDKCFQHQLQIQQQQQQQQAQQRLAQEREQQRLQRQKQNLEAFQQQMANQGRGNNFDQVPTNKHRPPVRRRVRI